MTQTPDRNLASFCYDDVDAPVPVHQDQLALKSEAVRRTAFRAPTAVAKHADRVRDPPRSIRVESPRPRFQSPTVSSAARAVNSRRPQEQESLPLPATKTDQAALAQGLHEDSSFNLLREFWASEQVDSSS